MQDSGAYEALAAKVDELARACAQLTQENTVLRDEVSRLAGVTVPLGGSLAGAAAPGLPGGSGLGGKHAGGPRRMRVSRRGFGMALAGAAAAVFGTTLFERGARRPAFADVTSAASDGVAASNAAAFAPATATAAGSFLSATLTSSSAVVAAANNGTGPAIQGIAGSTGPGVSGSSASSGAAVSGTSTGTAPGVAGTAKGSGNGVSAASAGAGSAIFAAASGTGAAISATSALTGAGVKASSIQGRGAIFGGRTVAQLQLTPGNSSHPTSGQMGDLYADSAGRLWFCKKTGSSATWKQIA